MASALKLAEMSETFNANKLFKINKALSELTNSLYEFKEKVQYHDSELEGKIFRFIMGNSSLLKLMDKVTVQLKDKTYETLDVPTINSITRMQIESFIMIYYLSFSTGSVEEKDMRYDIYILHGLNKQSNFPIKSEFGEKKREEILRGIEAVKKTLNSRQPFVNLDPKSKKEILKLKYAKVIKSDELFRESGISKLGVFDMWSLYSNHTHSEHISDRQYRTYYKRGTEGKLDVNINIKIHGILTAKLCRFLIDKFESPKKVLSRIDETSRALIYTWGYKMHQN